MRRALQRLQALAVTVRTETNRTYDVAKTALLFATLGILVAAFEMITSFWTSPLVALGVIVAATLALWLCWKAYLWLSSKSRGIAYLETDPLIETLGASHSVRCPSCNGFATLLRFDVVQTHPCPWCGATLAPSDEILAGYERRIQEESDHQATVATELLAKATADSNQRRTPRGRPSFRSKNYRGEQTWTANFGFTGRLVERAEVDVETGLSRGLFFCRPETEGLFRDMAKAWRAQVPSNQVGTLETRLHNWNVYSDAEGETLSPAYALALANMHPDDCLFMDRAGMSVWTCDTTLKLSSERLDFAIELMRSLQTEQLPEADS